MLVHLSMAFIATSASKSMAAFIISLLVLSSPFLVFTSPQLIASAPGPITPSTTINTSNYHSTIRSTVSNTVSSPLSATPTIQAQLQIPRTLQSTDIVNSFAFYEITFITSTTGVIDKIRMDFPTDTNIAAAGVIERVGIGGGILLKSGNSISYDITTPVSVPAGTFIRLEVFGIKNPTLPGNSLMTAITTRDSGGNLIDGPSATNVYKIRRIGTSDLAVNAITSQKLADGAITSTKLAESFMKRVTVIDDDAGHAVGWDPDGVDTSFQISEPAIGDRDTTYVSASVRPTFANQVCQVADAAGPPGAFVLLCNTAPVDTANLHYVVENLPPHIVG